MKQLTSRWPVFIAGCGCAVAVLISSQSAVTDASEPAFFPVQRDHTPALTGVPSPAASAAASDTSRAAIDGAVVRSLPLLQASARTWTTQRACASCHHQSLGTLAVQLARERGFAIDAAAAREQSAFTAQARGEGASVDEYVRGRGLTGAGHMALSYALTGLTAARWPADRVTDVLAHFVAGRQFPDGRFTSADHRPPHEDSHVAATAVAIRALLAYGRDRSDVADRVRRAKSWLVAVKAATTEDRAMQLLGLRWAGGNDRAIRKLQAAVLKTQRDDGGWSQVPTRLSDAYATGQVLVALNQTGHSVQSAAYRRGVAFLVGAQRPDGSWHVTTRRKNEVARGQPYFESGFPHGRDQFISYAGSAWATMALSLTRSPGSSPALTDTTARGRRVPEAEGGWTEGTTALMKAALLDTAQAVKALLDAGADPNTANAEGTTAIMWAATRGLESVRVLLARGANPKAADVSGFTPLMLAAGHSGGLDIMRALIAAGADVNALSVNAWSALRDAVKAGDSAKVQLLLDSGATLLISGPNTNRMMLISVTQDDPSTLELLLDRGLNASHAAKDGYTGLMAAAQDGLEEPLRLLLRRGADPDKVEARRGLTALMYAALQDPGHDRLVRALVDAGARLDIKSNEGLTAADYAAKYGHAHLLAALRRGGA